MAVNTNPPTDLDPTMDEGHKLAFINQNFHSIADNLNPFRLSDGSNDILLLGKDSTGNYVLKIANAGFNAFDATDANLAFSSLRKTLQIASSGTAILPSTVIGTGTFATQTVTVNYTTLASNPIVLAYITNSSLAGNLWTGTSILSFTAGASAITIAQLDKFTTTIGTSSTVFTCQSINSTGGNQTVGGYGIRYYILSQQL